jgi:DinB superfamily
VAERADIELVLTRLASAPTRFATLLGKLEAADAVASATEAGGWSPAVTLARVRAAQDILEPRILFVLVRDNPPLIGYEEARWEEVMRYRTLPVSDSLQAMRIRRGELVRALRALDLEDWDRPGTHEVRGPMTVLEIAQQIADLEDDHLAQIDWTGEALGG